MRAALLLTLALLLAGCGGGSDDEPRARSSATSSTPSGSPTPSGSATSTTEPAPSASPDPEAEDADLPADLRALRAAVRRYSDAFLTGDAGTSYALLSARCRARMPRGQWDQLLAMAAQQYGTALPMESLETFGSGDRMTVTYTYADGRIDQTDEPWVRERGGWHNDDC